MSYCLTNNLPAIAEILQRDASERKELLWSAILAGNIDVVAMGLRDNPQYDDAKWFNLLEQSVRGWRLSDLKINNEGFDQRNYITNSG